MKVAKNKGRLDFLLASWFGIVLCLGYDYWYFFLFGPLNNSYLNFFVFIFLAVAFFLFANLVQYHFWRSETTNEALFYTGKEKLQSRNAALLVLGLLYFSYLFSIIPPIVYLFVNIYRGILHPYFLITFTFYLNFFLTLYYLFVIYRTFKNNPVFVKIQKVVTARKIAALLLTLFISISGFFIYKDAYIPLRLNWHYQSKYEYQLPQNSHLLAFNQDEGEFNSLAEYQLPTGESVTITGLSRTTNGLPYGAEYILPDTKISAEETRQIIRLPYKLIDPNDGNDAIILFVDRYSDKLYVLETSSTPFGV